MTETFTCMTCFKEGAPSSYSIPPTTQRGFLTKCPKGHAVVVIFQASGWARLFERGLERIVLGDHRDAVLDIYTAFEMYLAEVPVRARYERESGASPTKVRAELKRTVSRAELAIGAARASASVVSGKPEITWSEEKTTKVRNEAIHSGVYPTEEKALELCEEVERTILEFERTFDALPCVNPCRYHEAIWREEVDDLQRAHPGIPSTFACGWDIFQWYPTTQPHVAALTRIEEYRKHPRTELRALLDAWVAAATLPAVAPADPAAGTS